MKFRRRNISVFSMSALDLFAAALAAFLLIVVVLFEYYNKGGTDETSIEELEEMVRQRRFVAESEKSDQSVIRALQSEIRLLDKEYKTSAENISTVEQKLQEVLKAITEIVIPDPEPIKPVEEPIPEPEPEPEPEPIPEPPRSTNTGQEFSILGLGTDKKNVVIVVDMSGSMVAHRGKVVDALNEVIDQMTPEHKFAIIGYRGGPSYTTFPFDGRQITADRAAITNAKRFVKNMPSQFGGGTPTQTAMLRALGLRPEAVILMSDGAPDDGSPRQIVINVTRNNRSKAEIHTVAIGNYTQDQKLTLFLQEMARNNDGDFVGRAR